MTLKIIPVIDLKNGNVVHAVQGKRDEYKVLKTLISATSHLNDLCSIFINQFNFETIYIADLDAIRQHTNQHSIIKSLLRTYPDLNIWLDSGLDLLDIHYNQQCIQIFGSEMNFDLEEYKTLKQKVPNSILSLDFSNTHFLGNSIILEHPEEWPETIILMNLDKVGSQQGFNIERIKHIQSLISKTQKLYIAGGVRNESDLAQLEDIGVDGVLISTSLHNLSITPSTISKYR